MLAEDLDAFQAVQSVLSSADCSIPHPRPPLPRCSRMKENLTQLFHMGIVDQQALLVARPASNHQYRSCVGAIDRIALTLAMSSSCVTP